MPEVGVNPEGGRYTWEDFLELEEDDLRELIDGELVEVEVPTGIHERIVALLIQWLGTWADAHDAGMVFGSGYKVRISKSRGVMPDVQFFRKENLPRGYSKGLANGHPDIAVEILSPSSVRYDRVTKLAWYAQIGTSEYWLVDPEHRTVERLVLHAERYLIAQALEGDVVFAPESCAGLEIPLAKLWSAVDELGAARE